MRILSAIAVWIASLGLIWSAATARQPDPAGAGKEDSRRPGERRDIVVYANPEEYASFPQIARTDQELVLLFQVQNLAALRDSGQHPHYQRLAAPRWAASCDGGVTWEIHETCPPLGPVRDITYGSLTLGDGGTVTLTFNATEPLQAIIQRGSIGCRPYGDASAEVGDRHAVTDPGPSPRFYPHGMTRLADGTLLAGGLAPTAISSTGANRPTAAARGARRSDCRCGATRRICSVSPAATFCWCTATARRRGRSARSSAATKGVRGTWTPCAPSTALSRAIWTWAIRWRPNWTTGRSSAPFTATSRTRWNTTWVRQRARKASSPTDLDAAARLVAQRIAEPPLEFDADFENGSLDRVVRLGPDWYHIILRQDTWYRFFFRVKGCAGREIIFEFTCREIHTPGYSEGRGRWYVSDPPSMPLISYDGVHWQPVEHIEKHRQDPGKYVFRHTFVEDEAFVSHHHPYTYRDMLAWLKTLDGVSGISIDMLGKTRNGFPQPVLTLTDAASSKELVVLICREDADEITASWGIEGLVRALLSPGFRDVLKRYTWAGRRTIPDVDRFYARLHEEPPPQAGL